MIRDDTRMGDPGRLHRQLQQADTSKYGKVSSDKYKISAKADRR